MLEERIKTHELTFKVTAIQTTSNRNKCLKAATADAIFGPVFLLGAIVVVMFQFGLTDSNFTCTDFWAVVTALPLADY